MDLSTGHMAYTVHAQDAERAAREREHRRGARERAAELTQEGAPIIARGPRRSLHGLVGFVLFRGHRGTAQ